MGQARRAENSGRSALVGPAALVVVTCLVAAGCGLRVTSSAVRCATSAAAGRGCGTGAGGSAGGALAGDQGSVDLGAGSTGGNGATAGGTGGGGGGTGAGGGGTGG